MFARIFAPKWRHPDPAVRRAALESLSVKAAESQDIFATVAREDEDSALRCLAIRRLRDLATLRQLLNEGPPGSEERAAAELHLAHLLCGAEDQYPDLATRRQFLTELNDPAWYERILREAQVPALRRFALAQVERQSVLGDAALEDADPALRLEALAKISQRSTLERVAKGARRRDKRIYSQVRQVLDELEAAEQRPILLREQAERLCTQVEALLNTALHNDNWEPLEKALGQILQQWRELAAELVLVLEDEADALTERFCRAKSAFDVGLAEWRLAQAELQQVAAAHAAQHQAAVAVCETLEAALAKIEEDACVADRAQLEKLLAESEAQWRALGELASTDRRPLLARYHNAVAILEEVLADHTLLAELAPQLEALQGAVQQKLQQAEVNAKALQRLQQSWARLARPRRLPLPAASRTAIEEGLGELHRRLEAQQRHQHEAAAQVASLVAELEGHLKAETYKPAIELAQRVQQLLDVIPGKAGSALLKKDVRRRWQRMQGQIHEMRDWRQWANAPVLESLCDDMERLAAQAEQNAEATTFDFADCAARVRAAREQWKQLSTAQGGAAKALWRRFDTACTRAYAPCEARFDAQQQQREAHLAAKHAICQGLEAYADKVAAQDAEQVDAHALGQIIHTADAEWKAAGAVPRKAQSAVNKRFRKVMDRLRGQLREQQQNHRQAKELLIQRADTLLQSLEAGRLALPEVVERAKDLQHEWKAVGRADKEGELWRRFRVACDAIFERRDAERKAHQTALQQDIRFHAAICETIEAAATQSGEALRHARHEVEQAQQQWKTGPRLPKRELAKLDGRFRIALERFDKQLAAEQEKSRRQEHQHLRDKAVVCQQLERLLESVVSAGMKSAQIPAQLQPLAEQWDGLGALSGPHAKEIEARHAQVMTRLEALQAGLVTDSAADLAREWRDNLEAKRRLCLQLEILAGVESPPEFRDARLRYQVEHMAEHMKAGIQQDSRKQAAELETQWYATGAVPAAEAEALEARFAKALAAL
jgi:exonuclease SbcC